MQEKVKIKNKTSFPKNIRHLREEKKISQKYAAQKLGISQALLSHYEKGIRECGLDFLVNAAMFYGVSTDYLLNAHTGAEQDIVHTGAEQDIVHTGAEQDIVHTGAEQNTGHTDYKFNEPCDIVKIYKKSEIRPDVKSNLNTLLYEKLLLNNIHYLFENIKDNEKNNLSKLTGEFLILSIYQLYKKIFKLEGIDDKKMSCKRDIKINEIEDEIKKLPDIIKENDYIYYDVLIHNSKEILEK